MNARLIPLFLLLGVSPPGGAQPVVITEFMAVNNGVILDDFRRSSDWIEIYNPAATNVNLGGWFLTDDRNIPNRWSFPDTELAPHSFLIVFASGQNQRMPGLPFHTSFTLSGDGDYLALVRPDGVTVAQEFAPQYPPQSSRFSYGLPMKDNAVLANVPDYLLPTPGTANSGGGARLPLVITEIMYHPAVGNGLPPVEFIELKNIGADSIDLAGVSFLSGILFSFEEGRIAPGQRVLIVSNRDSFETIYGGGLPVAGEFTGTLADSGERLLVAAADAATAIDVTYADDWHPITDGHGFSLVLQDETSSPGSHSLRTAWRASGQRGGSPGTADAPSNIPKVFVNEILSRPELPYEDVIELFNPNTNVVDISGWYLTDDFDEPAKFRMPPGVSIPAGGYLALDEHAFNTPGDDPTATGFGLGDFGEEVYLFSADPGGRLTGWVHGFKFGTVETNVTFGRHVNSAGEEHFVAQREMTFFAPNSGPRTGPVVLSEINYHPADLFGRDNTRDEYIELRNLLNTPLPLYDLDFPTNSWRVVNPDTGQVLFAFPAGSFIPAGGRLLVARVSPANPDELAVFMASNAVPGGAIIHGPMTRPLNNSGAALELQRPDAPQPGFVPFITVDRVRYADAFPWPAGAEAGGAALQRIDESAYGDDPANWWAAIRTPAAPSFVPPRITTQPTDATVVAGNNATLQVIATGSEPVAYQWFHNGEPLADATSSTLELRSVVPSRAGRYSCRLSNIAAVVVSRVALLSVVDLNRPTLSIAAPEGSLHRTRTSPVEFSGTSTDDIEIGTVWYQADTSAFTLASGAANWSASITLEPGWHTVRWIAVDAAGNASNTNTVTVLVQPQADRLALRIDGQGAISGARHGAVLKSGRSYTLSARPAEGHRFSHWSDWSDTLLSTNITFTFAASEEPSFVAHFVPGPFVEIAGTYHGLIHSATNPAHADSGSFTMTVSRRGTYSGRLTWRGLVRSLHGQLSDNLAIRHVLTKRGADDLAVDLQWSPESVSVSGTLESGSVAVELLGRRDLSSTATELSSWTGTFKGAFVALPGNGSPPGGTNTVTVNARGNVSLRGKMPDGTAFAGKTMLTTEGFVPVYLSLQRGKGSVFGWIAETNAAGETSFSGDLLHTRTREPASTNWLRLRSVR